MVLLIHHTRKDGASERGSSVLRGAADVMIECKKSGQIVTATCSKMKYAEEFADRVLRAVCVGHIVSGAIDPDLPHTEAIARLKGIFDEQEHRG